MKKPLRTEPVSIAIHGPIGNRYHASCSLPDGTPLFHKNEKSKWGAALHLAELYFWGTRVGESELAQIQLRSLDAWFFRACLKGKVRA